FLLSVLAGELAVGYYSTPFKIAFAYQILPLALIGALYPAMSEAAVRDRGRLGVTFTEGVRSLLLIALPIAFGVGVLASDILTVVYGSSFLPSAMPLAILAIAIPFTFVNFPAGYLLNAIDRQATNTALVAVATVANIGLNLILIPRFAATGAAVSALVATVLLAAMNFTVVHRAVRYELHAIIHPAIRILLACLAMSAVVMVGAALPLGVRVLLGIFTYTVVTFAVGAVRRSDLAVLIGVFRRRTASRQETTAPAPSAYS
ncbi:polysaccharide biosynthesis C-terminal domain-containing protein, partial [Candidatus Uhrbacteria bacterium]|nr:polysaccharide biosynthesis C-terminal domain-containing protein [Candidatus Uhrbacteria bacterium]